MKTTQIENICPHCGFFTTRAGHLEENVSPSKEDLSFCWSCGNVSMFNEKLKLVKLNLDELPFESKEEIARIKSKWRAIKLKETK